MVYVDYCRGKIGNLPLEYNDISGPIHDLGAFLSLKVLYGRENRLNGI